LDGGAGDYRKTLVPEWDAGVHKPHLEEQVRAECGCGGVGYSF